MGKALLAVIASVVALIALGVCRASGWIYERAERITEDLERISIPDY